MKWVRTSPDRPLPVSIALKCLFNRLAEEVWGWIAAIGPDSGWKQSIIYKYCVEDDPSFNLKCRVWEWYLLQAWAVYSPNCLSTPLYFSTHHFALFLFFFFFFWSLCPWFLVFDIFMPLSRRTLVLPYKTNEFNSNFLSYMQYCSLYGSRNIL